jgi:hypothetical protein
MDAQEIRNLQEAYLDVYAPQENIEEGLRSAVKRLLGGGKKEAEAPKPESRGEQLRKKYNVGPEKSDTSAKRQILDRSRARAEKDEKDYGDKPFQKQVANQSKAAHDRYLKAGYSKYGADDARGSGNKARKRAASLNTEQVDLYDIILSHLLDEGYAETQEQAEVIMVNMSEDWRESILSEAILEYQPFKDKRKRVKSKVKKLESQKSEDPKDLGFRNARLQKRIDSMKAVLGKKNKEITSASQQKSYDSMAKGGFKHHDDPQSKYYIK